ncbi:arylsulfatase [Geodermatophilus sp. DF01-2]|uniref:arylsulfatase n=1 Tax=Geodermatophilus sp. DF01-2 TaxID=2559610 RepID=UPI001074102D|nr:arylsulfatase [Geodermatophilus sp. DF01_2]TFV64277.1 arylsulfatase [Geodermatophilus sp. DF01_2]
MTGRPNVVVVLIDDVGFGAPAAFGGPVETPVLDTLAGEGLRYNRFHTTAICSPTRAALLTGRDAHATGVGTVLNSANTNPGYEGILRPETATVATVLKDAGYSTSAFGKWHLGPPWEASQAGPFDRWPTGQGFEKFYGFLGGETDQYAPTLYEGTTPIAAPDRENYHLTEDLAEQAIAWLQMQHSLTPERPFFLYFAPGATHAPLQVPGEWSAKYRGRFSGGWDAMREETLARQKRLGVLPEDAALTPRPDALQAWDSLGKDERAVAERLMEVYAGFLEHTDVQIGRMVEALKESGQFDNTLFVYVVGDNGSSAEGGPPGSVNYMGALQGIPEPAAGLVQRLDEIGGPDSYAQYPAGWAWAMTAPFQWVKQVATHLGGTRNPMVLTWPARISDVGGLRSQFAHVNDIAPTILEVAGVPLPSHVRGVAQTPMDGTSLAYSWDDAAAPERHRTQYFEVFGHRSIYSDGWLASAYHGGLPWGVGRAGEDRPFDEDRWELYDLDADFSQARDLAAAEPEKLRELQDIFHREAERVGILPLRDARVRTARSRLPNLSAGRTSFTFHPGTVGIPESNAPRLLGRSWTMRADLRRDGSEPMRGVIASMGGRAAGLALHLDGGRPAFDLCTFDVARLALRGDAPVAPGEHSLEVVFGYDGGGLGRGADVVLLLDGVKVAEGRIAVTPPAVFSIDETFDIGLSTGSAVGPYRSPNAFTGGRLHRVVIELR